MRGGAYGGLRTGAMKNYIALMNMRVPGAECTLV
jgi:hypothetical protein